MPLRLDGRPLQTAEDLAHYLGVEISEMLVLLYKSPDGERYRLRNWWRVGSQRALMQGFFIYDLERKFAEAEARMAGWLAEGRMDYLEDVLEGLEQMPRALMRLYDGSNVGKQLVRVALPSITPEPRRTPAAR